MLHRIVASANRQKRLVEELLLLSRLEMGPVVGTMKPVHLAGLVRRAVEDVRASYPGQRIDCDGPANLRVVGDSDRTLEIVLNLLDNAAKYSPEGSPIRVTWVPEGADVVVRVRDFGTGIAEGGRQQLFTRFGRLLGSRIRAGHVGTGLGLYLSREYAHAMGGTLDLESTGEEGSTFCLRLPMRLADVPQAPELAS